MNLTLNFSGKPAPEDLEQYRSYLKLLSQMQLSTQLRSKEDDSDVVQHVMMAACRDLDDFRGTSEGELKAWLAQIASNVMAGLGRHYSRQRRDQAREEPLVMKLDQSSALLHRSLIGKEASPSDAIVVKEDIERLIDALMLLSEDERTAIVLKHLHGRPIADIAEHLGRSITGVAGLLNRGLKKLRALLK